MEAAAKTGCKCPANVARVAEMCPECLAAWSAWREEDERQARLYVAYGAETREAA